MSDPPAGIWPRAALQRFLEPRTLPRPGEVCELCGEPIPEEHGHIVNVVSRQILCTCRACYLLFTPQGAAGGKFRAVPDRILYDPSFQLADAAWSKLQIPVGMAFFFVNSTLGRVVAFYPSPAGATESLLSLDTWQEVMAASPLVATLAPDVEAILLKREADSFACYLVPIDTCYELVGRVRRAWKGFDGGAEVWREIEQFFAGLRARGRPLAAGA